MERARIRRLPDPADLCSNTLRLSLHLSGREYLALRILNPDTLGSPVDNDAEWAKFVNHPDSKRYRVGKSA